ncbi:MAG: BON domain-containing protein [Pseudomonadota bacterium]
MTQPVPNSAEELKDALSAAFEQDPWIDLHRFPVRSRVEGDRLILEGQVEDVAAWRRSEVLARHLVGDRWAVENHLKRRLTEPMGDRELRDAIISAFSGESSFAAITLHTHTGRRTETVREDQSDAGRIMVAIEDGTVILAGEVGSLTHRRLAEAMCWWIGGCEAVDNRLTVEPPEEDSDDELNDAVRIVLEKDPTVHADTITVGTAAGVVHLDGTVATEGERRFAALDCFAVPGTWDVNDRLEITG